MDRIINRIDEMCLTAKDLTRDLASLEGKKGYPLYSKLEEVEVGAALLLEKATRAKEELLAADPTAATRPTIQSMGHDMPPQQRGCFS